MERDYRTLYNNFCSDIYIGKLFEEHHIVTIFNACINFIIDNLDRFGTYFKYSGWNFINSEKICKQLNNKNIKYPIYIKYVNEGIEAPFMHITDRQKLTDNNIYITINKSKCENNPDLYSILRHEFRHCLRMYILDSRNIIEKDKNCINIQDEKEIINKLFLTENLLNIFNDCIYYYSLSEQEAFIGGTVAYLENKNIKIKDFNELSKIVELTSDFNCLFTLDKIKEKIYNWHCNSFYKNNIILGYFLKKYIDNKALNKINILKNDILNIKQISIEKQEQLSREIVKFFISNYESYQKKLYDCLIYFYN